MNLPFSRIRLDRKGLRLLAMLFAASVAGSSCGDRSPALSDLKIRPEEPSVVQPVADPATGFLTLTFELPVHHALDLLESSNPDDPVVVSNKEPDPFGSSPSPPPPSGAVHQAFIAIGIPFPPGASATYDPDRGKLTVIQTPEAIGLIRHILTKYQETPASAAVRFEFYEVPALLSLRLEQSAAAHFDDTPEWDALQKLLDGDGARLLQIATLQTISGQRTKFEDGASFFHQTRVQNPEEAAKEDGPELEFYEERLVGTILETDLVIGADNRTMDLNLALEYHSAPPEWVSATAGPAASDSPPAAVFHVKKLWTQISIRDGETRLLTSWTPTGRPEDTQGDRRILVFVSANLQRASMFGE